MSNEWLELAWINCTKAILHGQVVDRLVERQIEQVLTDEQRDAVYDMNAKHERAMTRLLRGFVEPTNAN